MKLSPIAANRNIVTFNDGTEVFFSYSTPVAGYSPELGYIKTEQWYSSTTTRHINKYLDNNKATEVLRDLYAPFTLNNDRFISNHNCSITNLTD